VTAEMEDSRANQRISADEENNSTNLRRNHASKASYASNVDTNQFINTSKTDEKNSLLPEKHLKKLIKVTGDDLAQPRGHPDTISFDRNSSNLVGARPNESSMKKMSRASQFTFNSTENRQFGDGRNSSRNADNSESLTLPMQIKNLEGNSCYNEFLNKERIESDSNPRIKVFPQQSTYDEHLQENFETNDYPIMNSVRQILLRENDSGAYPKLLKGLRSNSIKTTESRESTQIIRDRLKYKIDTLRERISSTVLF
jgi:hypothetical protein